MAQAKQTIEDGAAIALAQREVNTWTRVVQELRAAGMLPPGARVELRDDAGKLRHTYTTIRPARQRFVWADGRGLVEVPPDWRPPPRRFHIIGDHHTPFRSMADGKIYDSKSAYRRELKARGYEELGDAKSECISGQFEPSDWRADLAETAAEYGVNLDDYSPADLPDNRPALAEIASRLGPEAIEGAS